MGCSFDAEPNEVCVDAHVAFLHEMEELYQARCESPRSHTVQRHGPEVELQALIARDYEIGPPVTKFYDLEVIDVARHIFLEEFREEMRDEQVRAQPKDFVQTVELPTPVGWGIMDGDPFYDIQQVTFVFVFEDGFWCEKTGYPDLKAHMEKLG